MENEGGDEGLVGEVDLREGVVEAAEGVAYEGAGWFREEFVLGSHVEYDGGDWVGDVIWFRLASGIGRSCLKPGGGDLSRSR